MDNIQQRKPLPRIPRAVPAQKTPDSWHSHRSRCRLRGSSPTSRQLDGGASCFRRLAASNPCTTERAPRALGPTTLPQGRRHESHAGWTSRQGPAISVTQTPRPSQHEPADCRPPGRGRNTFPLFKAPCGPLAQQPELTPAASHSWSVTLYVKTAPFRFESRNALLF